jgi:hypothetical protein
MSPFPRRAAPLGVFAGLCVLVAVAVASSFVHIADPGLRTFVDTYLFDATQIGFALLVTWRAVAVKAERGAWMVIGASMLLWCAGNVLWSFFLEEDVPIPSLADAAWLGAYPGFYLGLWMLFRARTRGVTRASLLDGAVVGLAVGAVCAEVVVGAVWASVGGATQMETATNLAYPVADLIVLTVVACAMVAAGRRPSASWALIAGGMAVFAAADSLYLWRIAKGLDVSGYTSTFWLFGLALMAVSAWMPARPMPARPRGVGSLAILIIGALIALGLVAAGSAMDVGSLANALAVAALATVLIRLVLTHSENTDLVERLHHDATTDPLTGLANRRKLLEDLQLAVDGAAFRPTALVVFDLDESGRLRRGISNGRRRILCVDPDRRCRRPDPGRALRGCSARRSSRGSDHLLSGSRPDSHRRHGRTHGPAGRRRADVCQQGRPPHGTPRRRRRAR